MSICQHMKMNLAARDDDVTVKLREVVLKAWPEGLAEEDSALLAKLTLDEENIICVRLAALLEVEQGIRPAYRAPSGDPRDISSSGFQSLVRRWRMDRTVRTLLPYATREPRRPKSTSDHDAFEAALERLLREDPSVPLVTVSKAAMASTGTKMAVNSARLRARSKRSAIRADEKWLNENYGRELLSDVCILGAEIDDDTTTSTSVIALVIDVASGYILGHAIGAITQSLELQRSSLADSLANISMQRLDRDCSEEAKLTVVLGTGDAAAVASMSEKLSSCGAAVNVIDHATRRKGDRVADVVDGEIDVLALRPRQGREARRTGTTVWGLDRLVRVGAQAVETHNAARKERIFRAIGNDRTGIGSISKVIRPVVDSL